MRELLLVVIDANKVVSVGSFQGVRVEVFFNQLNVLYIDLLALNLIAACTVDRSHDRVGLQYDSDLIEIRHTGLLSLFVHKPVLIFFGTRKLRA